MRQFNYENIYLYNWYNDWMIPPTRDRILEYLRKNQTASTGELSFFMEMTGANIRHHLSIMESYYLIEVVGWRKEGRGRPVNVYGLSQRTKGDGLGILAGALLETWLVDMTIEEQETELRSVAEKLAGFTDTGASIMKRLVWSVKRLNNFHYQTRWEASAAGPRIVMGHCPYTAIIGQHPELCRMDGFLLESMLGSMVVQTAKLQLSDRGLPFCSFLMTSK